MRVNVDRLRESALLLRALFRRLADFYNLFLKRPRLLHCAFE